VILMFGRTVSGFGSKAKRGAALSGSITLNAPSGGSLELAGISPGGSGTSNAGDIDLTAAGSGGSGSYNYAWAVIEADDSSNAFVVASAGTQNVAQYNTLTITGSFPAAPNPPANPALYILRCTISDGVSNVVVNQNLQIAIV